MTDIVGVATGVRDSIGRYFSVVSVVPSALLVVWVFLLAESGAWSGPPDAKRALGALSELGVGGSIGLGLATVALGLVLHPVQYGLVQLLEGYWGPSRLARRVPTSRIHDLRRKEREFASLAVAEISGVQMPISAWAGGDSA
jgi:hypothetical protein